MTGADVDVSVTRRCDRRRLVTTPASMAQKRGSSSSDAVRANARPVRVGHGARFDVDVVENLEMVRDKAHRAHHHGRGPFFG